MIQKICLMLMLSAFFACAHAQTAVPLGKNDLHELVNRMTGEFSSETQSKNDTSFYHIRLRMQPVWSSRKDGYWLYVEQAMASSVARPYRQRVYHVYQQDEMTLVSKVYEIASPLKYAGGADQPALLESLSADSLIDRVGCAIYLNKKTDGQFFGSTPGKECLSNLRGATYATSEVEIGRDMMVSWDRGWNSAGKQVWGSTKGGYRFVRILKD